MNILFASSEVHPYSKTGGLADVSAALAKFVALAGNPTALVTPLYRGLDPEKLRLTRMPWTLDVPLGARRLRAQVQRLYELIRAAEANCCYRTRRDGAPPFVFLLLRRRVAGGHVVRFSLAGAARATAR